MYHILIALSLLCLDCYGGKYDRSVIGVTHDGRDFIVHGSDGSRRMIQRAFIDKEFRGASKEQLQRYALAGAYASLHKMSDGDYRLACKGGLDGGGVMGWYVGACAGKLLVSGVGHGTLFVVSLVAGPAQPAAFAALEATFGPTIEAASVEGALVGGIIGGTATGPV